MTARGTSLAIHQSTNGAGRRYRSGRAVQTLLYFRAGNSTTSRMVRCPVSSIDQPVDADADPAGRRHAVLERVDVVLVERLGLLVARRGVTHLLLEARALVVRIVELGERVGELHAVGEGLEALDQPVVGAMALGERRELDGVVVQDRRLDQRRLDVLGDQVVDERGPVRLVRDRPCPARASRPAATPRSRLASTSMPVARSGPSRPASRASRAARSARSRRARADAVGPAARRARRRPPSRRRPRTTRAS